MLNELYCTLNNLAASDTAGVVAVDHIPGSFRAVRASHAIDTLWLELLSRDAQARQYWLCQIRRLINRAFMHLLMTKFDARQVYAVADLQGQLADYFRPEATLESGWRASNLSWWGPDYQLKRFEVRISGNSAELYAGGSSSPLASTSVSTAGEFLFTLDADQGITLSASQALVGGGFALTWATRPRESLAQRAARVIDASPQAIAELASSSASRFDTAQRSQLRCAAQSPAGGAMRAAAAGLLIAGHFAHLADNR